MLTLYLVSFAAVSWDVTQPPPPQPPQKNGCEGDYSISSIFIL